MRAALIACFIASFTAGCMVSTVEGEMGADGQSGPPGDDGVSPFTYVDDAAQTDIYYDQGKVGIGTDAPAYPLEVSGPGGESATIAVRFSDKASSAAVDFLVEGGGADITVNGPDHEKDPTTLRISTNGDGVGQLGKIILACGDHGAGGEIVRVGPGRQMDVADYTDPTIEGGTAKCPTGYDHDDLDGDGLLQEGECWRHTLVVRDGNVGIGKVVPKERIHIEGGNIMITRSKDFAKDGLLIIPPTSLKPPCDCTIEGALTYDAVGNAGHFFGCRRTGTDTCDWAQLDP